jgi:Nitroreductase family
MNPSRRNLLISAGGAGLALLGAGAAFAATRTPHRAFAPWQVSPADDVRLHAFRHAILAPNPHNRQPWLITLVGKDEALIHCDLERRLPVTDPFDRQITIGFGCFLELARIAAAERGVGLAIAEFPEGMPDTSRRLDGRPIAHLKFASATRPDPLFESIAIRRSVKAPFDTNRPVPPAVIETLAANGSARSRVGGTQDTAFVQDLRSLTWTAWMVEANTHAAFKESVDLMRIGKAEIEANPDGIALGGPMLEAMALTGLLSREQMLNPASAAFRAGIDKYRPIIATAMGYGWIVTGTNTRRDQLEAGRVYVRMNLQAARAGLSMHPISQALQEFPEMAKVREEVSRRLSLADGETLQMLARLGYAAPAMPSARWPLESRIRTA